MKPELTRLVEKEGDIALALGWAGPMIRHGLKAGPVLLKLGRPKRSDEQSRLMWSWLTDLSNQVPHYGVKLSAEDYKCLLTVCLRRQRSVPNVDGDGFVVLGDSTRKMTVKEMTELLDLIRHYGDSKQVQWTIPPEGSALETVK